MTIPQLLAHTRKALDDLVAFRKRPSTPETTNDFLTALGRLQKANEELRRTRPRDPDAILPDDSMLLSLNPGMACFLHPVNGQELWQANIDYLANNFGRCLDALDVRAVPKGKPGRPCPYPDAVKLAIKLLKKKPRPIWQVVYNEAKRQFPDKLKKVSFDAFKRTVSRKRKS